MIHSVGLGRVTEIGDFQKATLDYVAQNNIKGKALFGFSGKLGDLENDITIVTQALSKPFMDDSSRKYLEHINLYLSSVKNSYSLQKVLDQPGDNAVIAQQPTITQDKVGGIDLNPANLNMQIKRDGNGVVLPLEMQDVENIQVEGFVPVIIEIVPITTLPILTELFKEGPNVT